MLEELIRDFRAREPVEIRTQYILIVLLSALVVAFESVAVEGALNIENIDVFFVTAIPTMVGGLILMGSRPSGTVTFARGLGRKGWLSMFFLSLFAAIGILLWFDAVGRIGAGKEALLGGGSSEVLFVVILSALFLSERLNRLEAIGGLMIVVGVFIVLTDTDDMTLSFGFGELEVLISSLSFGCSIVLTTAMLKSHDLTPLSGVELFLSGVIVFGVGVAFGLGEWPGTRGLILLLLLGLFPAVGLLTYNSGLPMIGASLTSVLFALTGIMTVCAQLLVLLFYPDTDFMLPQNLGLAITGGAVAFIGVYLLNINPTSKVPTIESSQKSAEGEI